MLSSNFPAMPQTLSGRFFVIVSAWVALALTNPTTFSFVGWTSTSRPRFVVSVRHKAHRPVTITSRVLSSSLVEAGLWDHILALSAQLITRLGLSASLVAATLRSPLEAAWSVVGSAVAGAQVLGHAQRLIGHRRTAVAATVLVVLGCIVASTALILTATLYLL